MLAINEIIEKHKAKVNVHCCNYHAHSAKRGCLSGPEESIEICCLAEEIERLRFQLQKIKRIAEEAL